MNNDLLTHIREHAAVNGPHATARYVLTALVDTIGMQVPIDTMADLAVEFKLNEPRRVQIDEEPADGYRYGY